MTMTIYSGGLVSIDGRVIGTAQQTAAGTVVRTPDGVRIDLPERCYSLATDRPASGVPGRADFERDLRAALTPASDLVVVEWMPRWLRASHEAAGNSGSYPANGAHRYAVSRDLAAGASAPPQIYSDDPDIDYVSLEERADEIARQTFERLIDAE